ncbi:MAG: hypothetical protein U0V04_11030 [Spirosomataceae bacterium]|jgi:hypothetical protein
MKQKYDTSTKRNLRFEEKFTRGDLMKIKIMSGKSYDTVRKTLIYQTLHNQEVIDAAKTIIEFNKKIFTK